MEQLLEEHHVFREEVDRLSIVARDLVGHPQVIIGHDLESGVPRRTAMARVRWPEAMACSRSPFNEYAPL